MVIDNFHSWTCVVTRINKNNDSLDNNEFDCYNNFYVIIILNYYLIDNEQILQNWVKNDSPKNSRI